MQWAVCGFSSWSPRQEVTNDMSAFSVREKKILGKMVLYVSTIFRLIDSDAVVRGWITWLSLLDSGLVLEPAVNTHSIHHVLLLFVLVTKLSCLSENN